MALERLDTFEAVHPAWVDRLKQICELTGCWPQSVWRSRDLQARWRWCYLNGCPEGQGCHGEPKNCPGANPPDLSYHEYEEGGIPAALAVDLSWTDATSIALAHKVASLYDVHFPLDAEPWHIQPIEVTGSTSPYPRWTPFQPIGYYGVKPDPWSNLFVPILVN